MPQIFRIAGYIVYFWSNENDPLEPIHVHVSDGVPTANATKIWITQSGKCFLCHNNSKIHKRILRDLMDVIEARSKDISEQLYDFHNEIRFYC